MGTGVTRVMDADKPLFRAIVRIELKSLRVVVNYYGPYVSPAPALNSANRERKWLRPGDQYTTYDWNPETATGTHTTDEIVSVTRWVERCLPVWYHHKDARGMGR